MKTEYRTCLVCGETKPLTVEFWHRNRNDREGFRDRCKVCVSEYMRKRHAANPEPARERARKLRQENPELSKERIRNAPSHSAESRLRAYYENHEENLAYQREYRDTHREQIRAKDRKSYRNNSPSRIAKARAYWLSLTPEQKSRVNFTRNKNRRARVKGAEGSFTWDQYHDILVDQGFMCFYCWADISDGNDHADHYIPLSRGGTNWPNNIVAACAKCNQEKSDKTVEEFLSTTTRTFETGLQWHRYLGT